jgi:hypothetical protein
VRLKSVFTNALRRGVARWFVFRWECHMGRNSFIASVLVGFLRGAVRALLTFVGPSWDGSVRKYHPEKYYMRGPGPKWHEKHLLSRASTGSA